MTSMLAVKFFFSFAGASKVVIMSRLSKCSPGFIFENFNKNFPVSQSYEPNDLSFSIISPGNFKLKQKSTFFLNIL